MCQNQYQYNILLLFPAPPANVRQKYEELSDKLVWAFIFHSKFDFRYVWKGIIETLHISNERSGSAKVCVTIVIPTIYASYIRLVSASPDFQFDSKTVAAEATTRASVLYDMHRYTAYRCKWVGVCDYGYLWTFHRTQMCGTIKKMPVHAIGKRANTLIKNTLQRKHLLNAPTHTHTWIFYSNRPISLPTLHLHTNHPASPFERRKKPIPLQCFIFGWWNFFYSFLYIWTNTSNERVVSK